MTFGWVRSSALQPQRGGAEITFIAPLDELVHEVRAPLAGRVVRPESADLLERADHMRSNLIAGEAAGDQFVDVEAYRAAQHFKRHNPSRARGAERFPQLRRKTPRGLTVPILHGDTPWWASPEAPSSRAIASALVN